MIELLTECREFALGTACISQLAGEERGDILCLLTQGLRLRRETEDHLPTIDRTTRTRDEARRLEALQQRRERIRIQPQTIYDVTEGHPVLLPQDEQDQILRIGQPQTVKMRLVEACDQPDDRIEAEAQLILQKE